MLVCVSCVSVSPHLCSSFFSLRRLDFSSVLRLCVCFPFSPFPFAPQPSTPGPLIPPCCPLVSALNSVSSTLQLLSHQPLHLKTSTLSRLHVSNSPPQSSLNEPFSYKPHRTLHCSTSAHMSPPHSALLYSSKPPTLYLDAALPCLGLVVRPPYPFLFLPIHYRWSCLQSVYASSALPTMCLSSLTQPS